MDPSQLLDDLTKLPGQQHLLHRIRLVPRANQQIAFMVGSALSMPAAPGLPGVPDAEGIIGLARAYAQERGLDPRDFDAFVSKGERAVRYSAALRFLRESLGPAGPNAVVRIAVLKARRPDAMEFPDDAAYDRDGVGWAVSAGGEALATLLVSHPQFSGPVLTTNFDPLLTVAVRSAGGHPQRQVLDHDGRLRGAAELDDDDQQIVHLHGYWRSSDTLHTSIQLTAGRPELRSSLLDLLRGRILVVVGYGGWDDVFSLALEDLLLYPPSSPVDRIEVAWAFHDDEPGLIFQRSARLLTRYWKWMGSRVQFYKGIDCHSLFQQLLAPSAPATTVLAGTGVSAESGAEDKATAETSHRAKEALPVPRDKASQPVGPQARDHHTKRLTPENGKDRPQSSAVRGKQGRKSDGRTLPRFSDSDPSYCLREPMRELYDLSERFRVRVPINTARRFSLRMTFIPGVKRCLDELECVNPAEWPDPGWAVSFSATRTRAINKLLGLEAKLDSDPSSEIIDLLHILDQLRERVAERYPHVLAS
jgi:SIR2-like domain